MPDMAPPAPVEAQEPEGGGEGGMADALVSTDAKLLRLTKAVSEAPVDDGVKQAFAQALEAYRAAVTALQGAAQGAAGGEQQAQGPASMEQGASGAQPMSMGAPR